MKLRTRLVLTICTCSLVPLTATTLVAYATFSRGFRQVRDQAVSGLERRAQEQLTTFRDTKKAEIEDYFRLIRDQVSTFAENRMVVRGMRDFPRAVQRCAPQLDVSASLLARRRTELETFYRDDFAKEYATRNGGRIPDMTQRFKMLDDDSILLQHAYIRANSNPLGAKDALDRATAATDYNRLHGELHPVIRSYLKRFGYYDIFLVEQETGDIVYSVFKELDFTTSLIDGPFAATNFGRAFRQARQAAPGEVVLVDFESYAPSYEAPASFIAAPIFDGDERLGVAVFQMPIDRINLLMSQRSGMGETGEAYLVGPERLLRCDTFRDPVAHSIENSFRAPQKSRLNSQAVGAALRGETNITECKNYLGEEVISAFAPVKILGLRWALVADMTRREAFRASHDMTLAATDNARQLMIGSIMIALFAGLVVALVGWYLSARITTPIQAIIAQLQRIAEGDLSGRLDETRNDEFGALAARFNRFEIQLQRMIGGLKDHVVKLSEAAHTLVRTADSLSDSSLDSSGKSTKASIAAKDLSVRMDAMANSTENMSTTMMTMASSIEQMRSSISEIAHSAERSAGVADQASQLAADSNDKVGELGAAADDIGKVIEVIQDIAEQTNLLALNATIEAARAGEAGKGFAVVATEVKELAKQTAAATDDIRQRIEAIQESSGHAVVSITEIGQSIADVHGVTRTIASAVEEQSITTREISGNVGHVATTAERVATNVRESAEASVAITDNINAISKQVGENSSAADLIRRAGDELTRVVGQLTDSLESFETVSTKTKPPSSRPAAVAPHVDAANPTATLAP